jgi:hypothetical protein
MAPWPIRFFKEAGWRPPFIFFHLKMQSSKVSENRPSLKVGAAIAWKIYRDEEPMHYRTAQAYINILQIYQRRDTQSAMAAMTISSAESTGSTKRRLEHAAVTNSPCGSESESKGADSPLHADSGPPSSPIGYTIVSSFSPLSDEESPSQKIVFNSGYSASPRSTQCQSFSMKKRKTIQTCLSTGATRC